MRFACLLVAFLACACGRIGFGGVAPGDGGSDALDDGSLVDMTDDVAMPIDAPPSLCPGTGVNMCDGFEGSTLDPRWLIETSMGTAMLDTSRAYRGGTSLHCHVNAITSVTSDPHGAVRTYDGLPVANGETSYVRVFAYVPGTNPTRLAQYVNYANGAGLGSSMGEQNRFLIDNNYAASPADYRVSAMQFPRDRWVCIRYQLPANANGTIRVFVDDVEVTDIAIPVTGHPAPSHVYIGLDFPETFGSQVASDAWFDEVIIDNAPIACAD